MKHSFNQPLGASTKLERKFLGFKWDRNESFVALMTMGAFRPMGLMIWDCPPRTLMRQTLIGNQLQIVAAWEPIPADLFMMAKSYEQIAELLEKGIEPPSWPTFDSAHIGNMIHVQLTTEDNRPVGPPARVAMWGLLARE